MISHHTVGQKMLLCDREESKLALNSFNLINNATGQTATCVLVCILQYYITTHISHTSVMYALSCLPRLRKILSIIYYQTSFKKG